MLVYIAQRFRGDHDCLDKGIEAAAALRARGIDVLSPAEHEIQMERDPADACVTLAEHKQGFTWDMEAVLTVDAVVVLPGWDFLDDEYDPSKGVTAEIALARAVETPVLSYPDLIPLEECDVENERKRYARQGPAVFSGYLQVVKDPAMSPNGVVEISGGEIKGAVLADQNAGSPLIRTFGTGATRDLDDNKLDFEGCLSPLVLEKFAEYMRSCTEMADGSRRPSDNWQLGIPLKAYMKSMFRHFFAVWQAWRRGDVEQHLTDLMALLFNVQGMAHEIIKSLDD